MHRNIYSRLAFFFSTFNLSLSDFISILFFCPKQFAWDYLLLVCLPIPLSFYSSQEKGMGITPIEMMDRERACIPKLQIDFLDAIAVPVYRLACNVNNTRTPALLFRWMFPSRKSIFSFSWDLEKMFKLKFIPAVFFYSGKSTLAIWLRWLSVRLFS